MGSFEGDLRRCFGLTLQEFRSGMNYEHFAEQLNGARNAWQLEGTSMVK
jgi:hypothetical protein